MVEGAVYSLKRNSLAPNWAADVLLNLVVRDLHQDVLHSTRTQRIRKVHPA